MSPVSENHLQLARLDYFSHLASPPQQCLACGVVVPYSAPGAIVLLRSLNDAAEFIGHLCRHCRGQEQVTLLREIVVRQARQGQLLEERFRSALQHFLLSEPVS